MIALLHVEIVSIIPVLEKTVIQVLGTMVPLFVRVTANFVEMGSKMPSKYVIDLILLMMYSLMGLAICYAKVLVVMEKFKLSTDNNVNLQIKMDAVIYALIHVEIQKSILESYVIPQYFLIHFLQIA